MNMVDLEFDLVSYYIISDKDHRENLITYLRFNIHNKKVITSTFGNISSSIEQENSLPNAREYSRNDSKIDIDWELVEGMLEGTIESIPDTIKMLNVIEVLTGTVDYWLDLVNNPNDNALEWIGGTFEMLFSLGFNVLFEAITIKNDIETINSLLNNILGNLDYHLGENGMKEVGEWLIEKSTKKGLGDLVIVGELLLYYVKHGPDIVCDVFKLSFGSMGCICNSNSYTNLCTLY
ncbi:MAG: hypothetical protein ACRCTQ_02805 [Brevinemataceae bacterium]